MPSGGDFQTSPAEQMDLLEFTIPRALYWGVLLLYAQSYQLHGKKRQHSPSSSWEDFYTFVSHKCLCAQGERKEGGSAGVTDSVELEKSPTNRLVEGCTLPMLAAMKNCLASSYEMKWQSSKCKCVSWINKTIPNEKLGKGIQAAPSQGCWLHSSSAAGSGLAAGRPEAVQGSSSLLVKRLCSHAVAGRNVLKDSASPSTSAAWSEYWCAVCSHIKSHDLMPLPCGGAAHHSPIWHLG